MVNIFEKEGSFGILTLDIGETHDVLGHFNGKDRVIAKKIYEDPSKSDEDYREALKITKERGWRVIYSGERNWG